MYIDDSILSLVRDTLVTVLKIAFPVLAAGITIGLLISVFQSVTQIQEQTLTLVPKIFVMTTVAIILLPWIAMRLIEFSREMFVLF
ncbi:MAG: flagellar biosynthetic protein FliQ [Phycisphaeraceae bacterium]|nr:MAG: flagellar biosynthetic protein FliQ [Phycisphaeraceae bacterium]